MGVRGLFFLAAMSFSSIDVNAMLCESIFMEDGLNASNDQSNPSQGLQSFLNEHFEILTSNDINGLMRKINDVKRKINNGDLLTLEGEYRAIDAKLDSIMNSLRGAIEILSEDVRTLLYNLENEQYLRALMQKCCSLELGLSPSQIQCFQLVLRMFFLPNINPQLTRVQGLVTLASLLKKGGDRKVIEEKIKLLCIGNDNAVFENLLNIIDEYNLTLVKNISSFFSRKIIEVIEQTNLNCATYCLSDGKNLLHIVVQSNLVELAEYLLQRDDIDINEVTFAGVSTLKIAIDAGAIELVKLLAAQEGLILFIATEEEELHVSDYIARKISENSLSDEYAHALEEMQELFPVKENRSWTNCITFGYFS